MAIVRGSRYESVTVYTTTKDAGSERVKVLLHDRKYLKKEDVRDNFSLYEVKRGDLIDDIAFAFYGDEVLWWIIADVNDLEYVFDLRPGQILTIPNKEILGGFFG